MKVTLIIGDPRGSTSASDVLGTYMMDQMRAAGCDSLKIFLKGSMESPSGADDLLTTVSMSDLIILAFPSIYYSPPGGTIRFMEQVRSATGGWEHRPAMTALIESDLPSAEECENALEICQLFSKSAKLGWRGGLAMGMGSLLSERSVREAGFMFRYQRKALDLAAVSLLNGETIPEDARSLMSRPIEMSWRYLMGYNGGWRERARKNGVLARFDDLTYSRTKGK